MDTSESSLVERACTGSRDAFGELVTLYQHEIYAYVLRIIGDPEAAWDVAQDVFVRAYRCLGQLNDRGKFKLWLYAIAVNRCRNWLDEQRRQPLALSQPTMDHEGEEHELADPDPLMSPDLALGEKELQQGVQDAVRSLPLKYREVAVLRYQNDTKVSEVAESLGVSVAAVESRLRRAKDMLRRKLTELAQS